MTVGGSMSFNFAASVIIAVVGCGFLTDCGPGRTDLLQPLPRELDSPAARLARSGGNDAGSIDHAFKGKGGTPVIVLEEFHNSRASQIQHAITLVRLYQRQRVRTLGLEGYLKERPRIDGQWFTRKWRGQTPLQNARVAIRFLAEGEISEAEFMKLVFDDFELYPIETASQYNISLRENASDAMLELAERIDPPRAKEIHQRMEQAYSAGLSLSAEEHLAIAEDLETERVSKGIRLSPESRTDWDSWLRFWRGLAQGNQTMLAAISAVVQKSSSPVAMVIGAAHTQGIGNLLVSAGRPFAVVTPLALKHNDKRGDLEQSYDLKDQGFSVQAKGWLMTTIIAAVPSRTKKPEPVIFPVPWFEIKARIYQFTDRITNSILSPPNPPGGGKRPFGFSGDEFRTPLVQIDPRQIVYLPDDEGRRAVLFPIVLNPIDHEKRVTLWIKAGLRGTQPEGPLAIECLLKAALSEVQQESDTSSQTENDQREIQTSSNTVAIIGTDRPVVATYRLGAS